MSKKSDRVFTVSEIRFDEYGRTIVEDEELLKSLAAGAGAPSELEEVLNNTDCYNENMCSI